MKDLVGIIGTGSFGITLSKLLSPNAEILMYSHSGRDLQSINEKNAHLNYPLNLNVKITYDPNELCDKCKVIFPVVPSSSFRKMIRDFSHFLNPSHILIHGTKGFDYTYKNENNISTQLDSNQVKTMSQVIMEETTVVRIGSVSGPNLAKEILENKPAAAVVASLFDEVINVGTKYLSSKDFYVFKSNDIRAVEIAGAYKNIIALASGMLGGLDLGRNAQAMLITKGLHEMIWFGQTFGTKGTAFFGTAGLGDLVATASSNNSRNYSFGYKLAKGKLIEELISESKEVIEGLRTLKIVKHLASSYKLTLPITNMLYKIVYEGFDIEKAIGYLLRLPISEDIYFDLK